jgi:hypothetical protein
LDETNVVRGGCQCGATRYAAWIEGDEAYYCHCRMCQKAFGNLFGVFCKVKGRELEWQKQRPSYYRSSGIARRGFCPDCGTPLTFEYVDPEGQEPSETHLAVGSLDEPGRMRPVAHYGVESLVEPFFTDDALPRERTEDSEELVRKWKVAHGPNSKPGQLPGPGI